MSLFNDMNLLNLNHEGLCQRAADTHKLLLKHSLNTYQTAILDNQFEILIALSEIIKYIQKNENHEKYSKKRKRKSK